MMAARDMGKLQVEDMKVRLVDIQKQAYMWDLHNPDVAKLQAAIDAALHQLDIIRKSQGI